MDDQSQYPASSIPSVSTDETLRRWGVAPRRDTGFDNVEIGPNGAIQVKQYKLLPYSGGREETRPADRLEEDCPHCTGPLFLDLDSDSVSSITVAASGAFFNGLDMSRTSVKIAIPPTVTGWQIETIVQRLVPPRDAAVEHLWLSIAGPGMLPTQIDARDIVRLLKYWRHIGQTVVIDEPDAFLNPAAVAWMAAGCAVRAAYHARDAVVHQDPLVSREVVAEFAERWLGLRPTAESIDAVGNALLHAPLDGAHPGGDHAAVRRLPRDVRDQRRWWRDLSESRLRSARIGSLDRPLRSGGADPLTLLDTLGACDALGGLAGGWDERIDRVLRMLRPDERRVALTLGLRYADTWEHAALLCGLPARFGERVRRKLKREGAMLQERAASAVEPVTR
ncbi:hypothetical protein [Paractinoplanes toevensis]|uniref:Uncharacterized protein n=1 Tax=Paractinoplanes toevensis TaxID=571911 RepID=A0A919WBM2_9ACTN|nr:hypothetical protein [Actinoplanes toevensis]GIM97157.1 hypothetical protein Ato02nite_089500 [Actinoplanes toevensis]